MVKKIVLLLTALLAVCSFAFAQNKVVTGTVTGEDGAPIVGATVVVDGTTIGTSTDASGKYQFAAPTQGTISVSFIGYEDVSVAINGKTQVDVVMKTSSKAIDDIIVVAFGTAKKEAFTGAASVVDSEALATSQVSNAMQAMNGKVSGVQISNSTGSPADDGMSIRIRGFSSINAGQSPLIVLDGIPYDGSMNDINPADIENLTVLKDAASNALYGARGANGVIMVTTKKAKGRDAVVNVDAKWGVNQRGIPDYDYIKSVPGYYEQQYKALYNYNVANGLTPEAAHLAANNAITGPASSGGLEYQVYNVPEGQYFIGQNGKVNPNATLGNRLSYKGSDYYLTPDNWMDEIQRNGLRQEYNVSVAAGGDKSNFYTSIGYLNNEGTVAKTDYERLTARLKADYQAKKWLKVGANAAYSHSNGNLSDEDGTSNSSANIFAICTQVAPIYPLYVRDGQGNILKDSNGYTVYDYGDGTNAGLERPIFTGTNAVGDHMLNTNRYDRNAFNGNAFAEIKFLKDFKFTLNAGTNVTDSRSTYLTNGFYGSYAASKGILSKYHTRNFAYNFQQILNWSHRFGDHNIDLMIGHENYQYNYYYLYASKSNMFSPDNLELAGAITENGSNSYTTSYNTEGYFARAQYDWKDKLYISGSYRRDASSRFHPDYRWGNFWSVGAAWVMSKESWFNSSWIDMFKLKASYGSQGNDNLSNFLYTDTYDIVNSAGNVSLVLNTKGNQQITWESNNNFNAGVEFEMFKGRLSGNIEGFWRKTTDMLSWFSVPPSLGYTGYWANVGDMTNAGLEVELNGTMIRSKNVTWDAYANLTWVKNKISYLDPSRKTTTTPDGYQGYQSGSYFYGEGLPMYTWYLRQYAGVNKATGEPMWYRDVEVNGEIEKVATTDYSSATYYNCGTAQPDIYGGFGTTLKLYGFDLTLNFTYQIGGLVYDSGYATSMASPTSSSNGNAYHTDWKNAWTPENTNTNVPRFQFNDQYSASSSDRFLTSASYLNLQNINFGYTLPKKLTKKISIEKVRIYLACENVWLWSCRQGLDPRLSLTGSNNATTYSAVRTISGGINLTF